MIEKIRFGLLLLIQGFRMIKYMSSTHQCNYFPLGNKKLDLVVIIVILLVLIIFCYADLALYWFCGILSLLLGKETFKCYA